MFHKPLLALGLIAASSAYAFETTGKLAGIVSDQYGTGLSGATLRLSSPTLPGGAITTKSFEDGGFFFEQLPPGEYTLELSAPGHKTVTKKHLTISAEQTTSYSVSMDSDSSAPSAYATDTKSATQRNRVEAEASNLVPTNRSLQSLAAFLPGVLSVQAANPNIHGGSFRNNRYMIDGLDFTDPVTLTFGTAVNFDSLQEVEVLTGGLSAEYNAFGGVINAITKTGSNDFKFQSSFYTNNNSLSTQQLPQGETEVGFAASGPVLKDKLWYQAAFTNNAAIKSFFFDAPLNNFDSNAGRLKLTYQANQNNTINLSGGTQLSTTSEAGETPNQRNQNDYYAAASLDSSLSSRLTLKASLGFSQNSAVRESTGFTDTRERLQNNVSLTYTQDNLLGSHELKLGVQNAPTLFTQEFGVQDVPPQFVREDTRNTAVETGLYLQDQWRPTPFVTITPGVRVDAFSGSSEASGVKEKQISYSGVGPRLGMAWDPTRDGKTKLALYSGRFVEPGNLVLPSFISEENIILACDPTLLNDPSNSFLFEECRAPIMKERSFVAERMLGYSLLSGISGTWRKQEHLFEDDQANLIFDESGNNIIGAINGDISQSIFRVRTPDEAHIDYKGVDVYLRGQPTQRSWVMASYTYSQTTGTKTEDTNTQFTSFMDNPRQNTFAEGYLPWHAESVLKMGVAYQFNFGLSAGAWYQYKTGAYFDQITDGRLTHGFSPGENLNDPSDDVELILPNVNQVDVRLQYSLEPLTKQALLFTFDVFNLFNASTPLAVDAFDPSLVTQRQDPLSLQLGVRYNY